MEIAGSNTAYFKREFEPYLQQLQQELDNQSPQYEKNVQRAKEVIDGIILDETALYERLDRDIYRFAARYKIKLEN